ncbi:MAG: glycoside hydrolase family 31 protein [Armatimonadota bacterium]|nr:MAG: glycoside hydrolase family 31 protein [Armatimonadota bacterium]
MEQVAPGVWRLRLGTPEAFTPIALREAEPLVDAMRALPTAAAPFAAQAVRFSVSARGCVVELPIGDGEEIYGFGLQLKSHKQTGLKKTIRVNADPIADTGDSHAPVPFYVSTRGYGVFVDTARYASFYCGSHVRREGASTPGAPARSAEELPAPAGRAAKAMVVDVPAAEGVDVYVLAGPSMRQAIQRYNLFSGGGCLPPMWGLGVWYRQNHAYTADDALRLAATFREREMPMDVYGLEPGWQTHAYGSSYDWATERYPDPDEFLARMGDMGFKINLWTQAVVDPSSPLYDVLRHYASDYEVWGGIVTDMNVPEARAAYADHHERAFIQRGVSGFKVDECDNSDFNPSPWSFPEHSRFPSGMDGEQMHSSIGLLYQKALLSAFRRNNTRTYCSVRSSHGLAAPYPFVLYSDLYDHRDFVRGVVNAGFSGLLWSPEVRPCASVEDLIRRLQVVVLSAQALINAWNLAMPPWWQPDSERNRAGELLDNVAKVEAICRGLLQFRMALLPYLYSAFATYRLEGTPPIRAVVVDYPQDPNAYELDSQYLIGDALLAAPIFAGEKSRVVYLPPGNWYSFWTHERHEGGQSYEVESPAEQIPLFVRENTILPLAEPVGHIDRDTCFEITAYTFGPRCEPCMLFEDDGVSFDYERGAYNWVELTWSPDDGPAVNRRGDYPDVRYRIMDWSHIPE